MIKKIKKNIKYILISLIIFGISTLILKEISTQYGIGILFNKSLKKKLLIFSKDWHNKIVKGKIIYFTLPVETFYYKKGSKFGKIVMCKEGDKLKTQKLNYYCNGKYLGTAKITDKNGLPVSSFIYNGKIPKGNFFVMGTHERSYDSRYWGFVNENQIKGIEIWSI